MSALQQKQDQSQDIQCPWCDSKNTKLLSPYGPSVAEMQYKCLDCDQGFGWMKWERKLPEA